MTVRLPDALAKRLLEKLKELDQSQHHDRGTGSYVSDPIIEELEVWINED